MKKLVAIAILALLALLVSCEPDAAYKVGDIGPAGGYTPTVRVRAVRSFL